MRIRVVAIFLAVFMLVGCRSGKHSVDNAISFRNKLLESNGCSFSAAVTADYGDKIYHFSMDCTTDKEGNLCFTAKEPVSISGITGNIRSGQGEITFDDKVLAFPTIAEERLSPVSCPWVLMKALRSGYIRTSTKESDGFTVSVDDSYAEDALNLEVFIKNNTPHSAEIYWKGRRVLEIFVENFSYL